MNFRRLLIESSEFDMIYKLWDKLKAADKKLDGCYDEDGNLLVWGNSIGGKKGACTKASAKLYSEIDKVFGKSSGGRKALEVYTALQNGTDLSKIEKA